MKPAAGLRAIGTACLFMLAFAVARAEVRYRIRVDNAANKVFVQLTVSSNRKPVQLQIPNWMPGHYVLDQYSQYIHDVTAYIHDVTATDSRNTPLAVRSLNPNTWQVDPTPGALTVSYWAPLGSYKRFAAANDTSFAQISGPVYAMYVVGKKQERVWVSYEVPAGWAAVTSLDPAPSGTLAFVAPDYDTFADAPLSTGIVLVDNYEVDHRNVKIVLEGDQKLNVDRKRLLEYCKRVSLVEARFFGAAPYHRYVWHFIVTAGASGGLEHLSSTQISLSPRLNPLAQTLLAHEHFHLWNVKRIRPAPLGPFDYNVLPQTGALWWCEGVTDYYASLLCLRGNAVSRENYLMSLARNYSSVESNPARLQVSAEESSRRISESASAAGGGRSNSGYRISFYSLGWLCGLCLDTEIRYQTHGRRSLDDVMRSLYRQCRNGRPGFSEGQIRTECIRWGGPNLGPFYDRVVKTPGELPIADQLAKMGLAIRKTRKDLGSLALDTLPDADGSAIVQKLLPGGDATLQPGDRIDQFDGVSASPDNRYALFDRINDRSSEVKLDPVHLRRRRGTDSAEFDLLPQKRSVELWIVTPSPETSAEAAKLGNQWLATDSRKPRT